MGGRPVKMPVWLEQAFGSTLTMTVVRNIVHNSFCASCPWRYSLKWTEYLGWVTSIIILYVVKPCSFLGAVPQFRGMFHLYLERRMLLLARLKSDPCEGLRHMISLLRRTSSLVSVTYSGVFNRGKCNRSVKLTFYFSVVLKVIRVWSFSYTPLSAFMAWS